MKCYVHPDVDAVGNCAYCGNAVCSSCKVEMGGKLVCKSCIDKMASGQPLPQPKAPAAAPVTPPVAPPAPPAQPEVPPVQSQPVAPPVAPPVTPPVEPPVAPPVAPPAAPPAQPPVAPVVSAPAVPVAPARKEPFLSAILSFLIPGLGQVYNGQIKKGIILVIAYIALWVVMFIVYFAGSLVTMGFGALCCIPVLFIPLIVWVYGMYDGYVVANKINKGEPTKDWL